MENKKNPTVETETTETENVEIKEEQVKEEKTFTQKELNEIVEQRLAKAKKGIPSKEELQAFNNWKESQKSEEEKKLKKKKKINK